MRRHIWPLLAVVAVGGMLAGAVAAYEPYHPTHRYRGKLVAGEWSLDFRAGNLARILVAKKPITGFAFGPGRAEVAYCGPVEPLPGSGLWVRSVPDRHSWTGDRGPGRLLWAAPAGVTLRGPVRWAPDGSRIALLAGNDETSDLVMVDYAGGDPVWLTRGTKVADAAWQPGGERIAYLEAGEKECGVVVDTVPPSQPRRVGHGGHDLRWSLDGTTLCWLQPESETVWREMSWDSETDEVRAAGPGPPRPEGAVWSPDGRLCAALQPVEDGGEMRLVLFRTGSPTGQPVLLPDVQLKQLLGWSPDGLVLLVLLALGDEDVPFAISAPSHDEDLRSALAGSQGLYSKERVVIAGVPISPEAGLPSWSSGGDMLVYVLGKHFYYGQEDDEDVSGNLGPGSITRGRYGLQYDEDVSGYLGVHYVEREHVGPAPDVAVAVERDQVVSNMKHLALALHMYAADWNGCLLPSTDVAQLKDTFADYLRAPDVFMRPGSEEEVAVKFLADPGASLSDFDDPFSTELAIVDYHPDFYVVVYADGHVEVFDRKEHPRE